MKTPRPCFEPGRLPSGARVPRRGPEPRLVVDSPSRWHRSIFPVGTLCLGWAMGAAMDGHCAEALTALSAGVLFFGLWASVK